MPFFFLQRLCTRFDQFQSSQKAQNGKADSNILNTKPQFVCDSDKLFCSGRRACRRSFWASAKTALNTHHTNCTFESNVFILHVCDVVWNFLGVRQFVVKSEVVKANKLWCFIHVKVLDPCFKISNLSWSKINPIHVCFISWYVCARISYLPSQIFWEWFLTFRFDQ